MKRLAAAAAQNTRGFPSIRGERRRHACFYPPRTGSGIQTQRDPRPLGLTRESHAALRAGAPPIGTKADRCTPETCRSSETRSYLINTFNAPTDLTLW